MLTMTDVLFMRRLSCWYVQVTEVSSNVRKIPSNLDERSVRDLLQIFSNSTLSTLTIHSIYMFCEFHALTRLGLYETNTRNEAEDDW
jgi:hypothetical protein